MVLRYYPHKSKIYCILIIIISLIFTYLFSNEKHQGALPYYLSASLNEISLSSVSFSEEETLLFKSYNIKDAQGDLPATNGPNYFKFSQKSSIPATAAETISKFGYIVSVGFLLYLKFLRFFFAWMPSIGDITMVIIGNTIIHISCCFAYLKLTPNLVKKRVFTLFYFLNPLIIILYTFPYYYYLLVLPSVAAIYIYQNNYNIRLKAYVPIFIILLFSILVRPTVTIGILCICLITALLCNTIRNWIAFILLVVLVALFYVNNQLIFGPWHTMYIGIGAYANNLDIALTDQATNDFYQNIFLNDKALENNIDYIYKLDLLKNEVLRIVHLNPILYIYAALKNLLHLYGFGYSVDYYWFQYLSMTAGALYILLSVNKKLYFHLIVILTLNVGYVFYFPPVPMYMAGTYILLIHGWLEIFSKSHTKF